MEKVPGLPAESQCKISFQRFFLTVEVGVNRDRAGSFEAGRFANGTSIPHLKFMVTVSSIPASFTASTAQASERRSAKQLRPGQIAFSIYWQGDTGSQGLAIGPLRWPGTPFRPLSFTAIRGAPPTGGGPGAKRRRAAVFTQEQWARVDACEQPQTRPEEFPDGFCRVLGGGRFRADSLREIVKCWRTPAEKAAGDRRENWTGSPHRGGPSVYSGVGPGPGWKWT